MGCAGRFCESARLIDSARHDLEHEEDNPRAREWRNRACRNIDDAMAVVRKGGYDKLRDEERHGPPPRRSSALQARNLRSPLRVEKCFDPSFVFDHAQRSRFIQVGESVEGREDDEH